MQQQVQPPQFTGRPRLGLTSRPNVPLVACLLLVASTAFAQDEINIDRLDFSFEKPKTVIIYPTDSAVKESDSVTAGRIYWYLPFKLTNKGSKAAKFFVTLSAGSDKGKKYSDLPLKHVEEKIERVEGRKLASKADLHAAGKKLDTYEEYAPGATRECVAVFNPIDPEADKITIEIRGLVNDVKMEELSGGTVRVHERVLKLVFTRPGDEYYTSLDQFQFESKKWETVTHDLKIARE